MTAREDRALNALQRGASEQLRAAVRAEHNASLVAAVVPFGFWLWLLRDPVLPAFGLLILAMAVVRSRAFPAIDRGDIERAVGYFMVGKWTISIALAFVLPIALPIVVVNLIMPIVLAATNLPGRRFVPVIVASVAVAFVAASIGYTTNYFALDERVEPWIWQWLCVIVLTIHFLPLSIILWRTNQQHQLAFQEALEANEQLTETGVELQSSRRRLVSAADSERSRIERDLHDGAQQQLVSVLVQLRLANQLAERGQGPATPSGAELAQELEAAIANLRDLAQGIYPPLLKSGGLEQALRAVGRKSPADVVIDAAGLGRYDRTIEAAVYFCCLEAIQNAVKHGPAERRVSVSISLRCTATHLAGSVCDDGTGFEVEAVADGSGLQNMSDRIGAAGGTIEFASTPGDGTTITFEVPAIPEVPSLVAHGSSA